MSLDRRLRDALEREAAKIDPDVGRSMIAVEARARGRTTAGLGPLLMAAAAVVLLAVGLQALRSTSPDTGPGASVSPTVLLSPSPRTADIAGMYRATLEASDGSAELADVAGEWTMELMADGVLVMTPPATFREGSTAQSGVAYSIDEGRFRSNLFQQLCNSVGEYGWVLGAGTLTFTPIEDDCALRRTVLASTSWIGR